MATTAEVAELEAQDQPSRRSHLEVTCDVLEVLSAGTERPTRVINRANISWRVFNNCLRTLLSKGLVLRVSDGKREVYQITEKGYSVLAQYRDLKSEAADHRQDRDERLPERLLAPKIATSEYIPRRPYMDFSSITCIFLCKRPDTNFSCIMRYCP